MSFEFVAFIILFSLGYFIGSAAERKHYRSIKEREVASVSFPAVSFRSGPDADQVERATLVLGSVVVSTDYFKRMVSALRKMVGGTIRSYETLVDRARREAVLRMKAEAAGADMVVNVRIETSAIGQSANRKKTVGSVEAIAYGTALWLRKT